MQVIIVAFEWEEAGIWEILYPDNSPPGQFPTIHVLVLMNGFTGW